MVKALRNNGVENVGSSPTPPTYEKWTRAKCKKQLRKYDSWIAKKKSKLVVLDVLDKIFGARHGEDLRKKISMKDGQRKAVRQWLKRKEWIFDAFVKEKSQ